jgi:hypothetical protein
MRPGTLRPPMTASSAVAMVAAPAGPQPTLPPGFAQHQLPTKPPTPNVSFADQILQMAVLSRLQNLLPTANLSILATYSNEVLENVLDVAEEQLAMHGSVNQSLVLSAIFEEESWD